MLYPLVPSPFSLIPRWLRRGSEAGRESEETWKLQPLNGKHFRVHGGVHDDDECGDDELHIARQTRRIDPSEEVIGNEVVAIALQASANAKHVFVCGERAAPVHDLNEPAPDRRGQMNPRQLAPSQHQQTSQRDEEDECEVEEGRRVSEDSICHPERSEGPVWAGGALLPIRAALPHRFLATLGMTQRPSVAPAPPAARENLENRFPQPAAPVAAAMPSSARAMCSTPENRCGHHPRRRRPCANSPR